MNVANFAKRRALLSAGLAFPLVARVGRASTLHKRDESVASAECLFSGLAGLDYAMGGIAAGELACVTSPPHSGKTLVLLDWAARICGRYGKNVVFYSANEPSVHITRKGVARGRARVFFAGETQSHPYTEEFGSSGAIIMLDARSGGLEQAQTLATWLQANHAAGCAALVSDGWCTTQQRPLEVKIVDGVVAFPAQRWAPTFLPAEKLSEVAEFARINGLPVILGVQTASLVDDDALADSLHLSLQLRLAAHRWLAMHRPNSMLIPIVPSQRTRTWFICAEEVQIGGIHGVRACGLAARDWSLRRWCEQRILHNDELGSGLANSKRHWFSLLGD